MVALPASREEPNEIATPGQRFSLLEITGGIADDSREAAERNDKRRIRDLRRQVKTVRGVVTTTRGLAGVLATDWQRAVRFSTRFGVTGEMFGRGVLAGEAGACSPRARFSMHE